MAFNLSIYGYAIDEALIKSLEILFNVKHSYKLHFREGILFYLPEFNFDQYEAHFKRYCVDFSIGCMRIIYYDQKNVYRYKIQNEHMLTVFKSVGLYDWIYDINHLSTMPVELIHLMSLNNILLHSITLQQFEQITKYLGNFSAIGRQLCPTGLCSQYSFEMDSKQITILDNELLHSNSFIFYYSIYQERYAFRVESLRTYPEFLTSIANLIRFYNLIDTRERSKRAVVLMYYLPLDIYDLIINYL